jgi:hypothetical protein
MKKARVHGAHRGCGGVADRGARSAARKAADHRASGPDQGWALRRDRGVTATLGCRCPLGAEAPPHACRYDMAKPSDAPRTLGRADRDKGRA